LTSIKSIFAKQFVWHFWLIIFLFLTSSSCSRQGNDDGSYSAEFVKIQPKVEKLWSKGKVLQGLNYLDSAYTRLPHPSINDRFRYYGYHYVYNQKTINNYSKGLAYADSMVVIAKKSVIRKQYSANYTEANFCRGDALFELKQYTAAYEAYYQGYITGKKYLNKEAIGNYTYRMGMIMYKKGHYNLAKNYFKECNSQFANSGNDFVFFYRRQELFDNIGLAFKHLNQNDSALVYFDKAINYIEKYGSSYPDRRQHMEIAKGVIYGNKADIYIIKGDYKQAASLLKKSISINIKPGYENRDAQLSEIKLGQIYVNLNQYDSLKTLLTDLRSQLDTFKNIDAEADYNRLIGNYYLQQNDLKKAVNHIQLYNTLKDSISKSSNLLLETDVEKQLDNYEKQHEIETLSNNNKLQVIYLYVTVFFIIMAVIIVFLVYRNWRRSRKDVETVNLLNRQINEQNSILEDALEELKISSQEKDRILRTVAHDLRNPIGGIASLTGLMAEYEFTEEQKEYIDLIKQTSFNSLELINEILEATNTASSKLKLEQVDINSLVNSSVELLRFKAAEKGQQIAFKPLDDEQDLYISREKIWRVVSNLISNAIKFSPSGASICVKLFKNRDQVIIAVEDNGIGIPDDMQDQVFNMFTNAQRPGTAGEKSFGLGLSICKQIMDKHHGKIWFESNHPGGTIFYISLPFTNADVRTELTQKISVPAP
jgi:two-component system sensor histidine kinase VicK